MSSSTNYVGIDISKSTFDVATPTEKQRYSSYQFSNEPSGFQELLKVLPNESWCVMEASGPYYLKLASFLVDHGIRVSVVNPLVIRRFCQMRMMRAKTDKKDAQMIAEYGFSNQPDPWEKEVKYVLELKQLQSYIDLLNKHRTSLIRQMEAFKHCTVFNKEVALGLRKTIHKQDIDISKLEAKMLEIVQANHSQMLDQLRSIPGIGNKTAMQLIVLTGGFSKFKSAKQVSSYFGLSPRIFESGTSIKGRARICKMGMGKIRAMLYICSWTAKKCNLACYQLYERLIQKGKSKKLALIAVANKLLKQAFALATKKQYYDQNFSSGLSCF